jgi:hypothetical protein
VRHNGGGRKKALSGKIKIQMLSTIGKRALLFEF